MARSPACQARQPLGVLLVGASQIPAAAFWVDTAQLYFLPDDTRSIATEGLEGSGAIVRTVTGGTGRFRGYVGEQHQEFLGFNATGGVTSRCPLVRHMTLAISSLLHFPRPAFCRLTD